MLKKYTLNAFCSMSCTHHLEAFASLDVTAMQMDIIMKCLPAIALCLWFAASRLDRKQGRAGFPVSLYLYV